MRIFLSYGHDDYVSLALRIKRDLEEQGHEVWFDAERLKTADDWERRIEDGLDRVSAVPGAGRFLLLMTPHSVRRPDGYCLNELTRACVRDLPIIPVMVSKIEPPLSIYRLQWLDMRQCFPAEQHEEQYAKQFTKLVTALTEKQVPFDGLQQRLYGCLDPIAYSGDLSRHLLRFTGRAWVMPEVDKWLASSRRVLWITGEAGVGKSALAAWLCDKRPEIAAYHFCHSDRVDTRRALFSLAYQLSTQVPVYQDRLNASALEKTIVETNVPTIFDRLFVDLLADAVSLSDEPRILLIDALDEAKGDGKNQFATLIGSDFDRLPPWIRVIVTSRPYETDINSALQALDPWKLDAGGEDNRMDISTYLYRELRPFAGDSAPSDDVVRTIVDKSEGLFLYVNWVRKELESGRLTLAEVDTFPQGLGGVYGKFFERYFPDLGEYKSICRPALEAICAAREPLQTTQLASLLGRSEYEMRELMAQLGSLFPAVDDEIRPFHQSVRDWLINRQRSGAYWIDVSAQEHRLADLAWREYQAGVDTMGTYCIKYAPSHLATCKRKAELQQLLLDPDWIQAKLQKTGVVPLLADYELALDLISSGLRPVDKRDTNADSDADALKLVMGAIRLSSNVIAKDPGQFASQMVGRLLPYQEMPAIDQFIRRVAEGARPPWLRPLQPALHPPGSGLLRTLTGHSGLVTAVAVTPDGQRAVSASHDKTLKVWELGSGRELRTLTGHSDEIAAVAVTPDGQRAVSASWDKTLKVWELGSGRELRTLTGHSSYVYAVAVTPDGQHAVSASYDNALKVWELGSGRELRTLTGHSSYVNAVAVTPDGQRAVSASHDKTLKVWELGSGRELRTLTGHSGLVTAVAVTPDGQRAVSASWDKTLKVWELGSGRELRTLTGHSSYVYAVAVTPDGQHAVSASWDKTLKVWELGSGRELRTLTGHSSYVYAVAVTPDGQRAVSASHDKTLKVWELGSGRELRILTGHTGPVHAVVVTPDGQRAVSASYDNALKVWELGSGRELRILTGHSGPVNAVAVTPDGQRAVSASYDNALKVWELGSGRELRILTGHSGPVNAVAVTPDGQRAVSASWDKTLKVWELGSGRELRTLTGHSSYVYAVAVTPDGQRAVSASYDNALKVWELGSGRELRTLPGHTGPVTAVAVTPDGQHAVSASWDDTLKVWELESGEVLATFTCDAAASSCAWADALKLIVAGDQGGHVHFLRLEEPKTGAESNREDASPNAGWAGRAAPDRP